MAILHRAKLHPTKLELLTGWLPGRRWYRGPAAPTLTQVGACRFDDPAGEVGVETLLVTAGDTTVHHVPLTYRGAPLPGGDAWLLGTVDHSVLGQRWIYDASGDPVYAAVLAGAILAGADQAEELVDVDGRLERREPTLTVASTAGAAGAAPVIEAVDDVLDGDEATSVVTAAVILSVVRRPGPGVPSESAPLPALTGAWAEQPGPVVLALAEPR